MSELEESIFIKKHINQFYWGLLVTVHEKQLVEKTNLLVLWCHYNLVRRGMKNVGLGEYTPTKDQEDKDLPEGWNKSLPCRMHYLRNKSLFILTILAADNEGEVLLSLSRTSDNKITLFSINLSEIMKIKGKLEEVIPNWMIIQIRLDNELINPLIKTASEDVKYLVESTCPRRTASLPPASPYGLQKPKCLRRPRSNEFFLNPPLGVGSSHLNPSGSRGAIPFQPPGMGMSPSFMPIPPCPNPPRVRFRMIPSGPGHSNGRGRGGGRGRGVMQSNRGPDYPDPEHRPPPGYEMF